VAKLRRDGSGGIGGADSDDASAGRERLQVLIRTRKVGSGEYLAPSLAGLTDSMGNKCLLLRVAVVGRRYQDIKVSARTSCISKRTPDVT
jgi:hypothetical protein